jgi:hypothetical protein
MALGSTQPLTEMSTGKQESKQMKTERGKALELYLIGIRFESQLGHRLSILIEFCRVFLSTSRQICKVPPLNYDRFRLFQFIIHFIQPFVRLLDSALK